MVGVDGSDHSRQAIRWVAQAVSVRKASLTLVHALAVPDLYAGVLPPTPKVLEAVWSRGTNLLHEAAVFAERLGVPHVDTKLRDGTPNAVLREASRTARALVLGGPEHGRLGDTATFGSIAPQLAAHADCPVVVARGEQPDRVVSRAPVVVGIDGSPVSELAVAAAFEEASFRGVRLIAVHAWSGRFAEAVFAEPVADWPPLEQLERQLLAERLAGWSEKYPDVTVERRVVQQRPGHALVELSRNAQLVVVGSRGRGGFPGLLLGSTSQKLIYHAGCPVMVVRPDEVGE